MTTLITEEQIFDDIVTFLEEDKEYWLRKRPEDKKSFRRLAGEAAKGQKHVKKGAPFYLDPPRYSGNKNYPGLGLLEEQAGNFDAATLKSMKIGDILQVVPKKDIEPLGGLAPTALKAGITYTINKTKDGEFSISPPVMSRREFSVSTFERFISPYVKPEEFDVTLQKSKEKKKLTKDTEITPRQQEKTAEKLTKKYIPDASEGFIQKIGDWFKDSAMIKTIGDVMTWFKKLLGKMLGKFGLGGDSAEPSTEETPEKEISTDAENDLGLSYREIRNKFKGYKGETTGFRGYIHFLWDQFDKNKNSSLIQGWTKQKTEELVRKLAPKYGIPAHVALGVMAGESGGMPVGIYSQTTRRRGSPSAAIKANSTAYGSGQVTQTTYEKIKNQVGVPHYMLWDPRYGIEATIATIAAKLKRSDGNLASAMQSYAGTAAGGRRKMAAITRAKRKYGVA